MDGKIQIRLEGVSIIKTFKLLLLITLPTILILLVILELFFKFIIPASDPPASFFDEKEKMFYFSNEKETGLTTIGRFAEIKTSWRINNKNWNSSVDYCKNDNKKLIAVIGDSYVEAFQVNVEENYSSILNKKLNNDYEVYSFGKSGAPFSQYLHISRYVNKLFKPDILIFNIIHNDFDESVKELYASQSYFMQLSINEKDSVIERVPKTDYSLAQYKPLKRMIYKSALFRYLYINLNISSFKPDFSKKKNKPYEANINADEVKRNKELIIKATDYMVKIIRNENADKRIIFVFDAPRTAIYDNKLENSSVLWMHEMMKKICESYNVEYLDLTTPMDNEYKKSGKKFNSEIDMHWNKYGHEFVAKLLYEYIMNIKL